MNILLVYEGSNYSFLFFFCFFWYAFCLNYLKAVSVSTAVDDNKSGL